MWPDELPLRDWQRRAVTAYHAAQKASFLAYISTGAGKTRFALRVAYDLLEQGAITCLIVIVHTTNLRTQWTQQAENAGLQLKGDWESGAPLDGFTGAVVTYQQIASA